MGLRKELGEEKELANTAGGTEGRLGRQTPDACLTLWWRVRGEAPPVSKRTGEALTSLHPANRLLLQAPCRVYLQGALMQAKELAEA